jgi:hypothetical protein
LCGIWTIAEAAVPEITDPDYHLRLRLARAARADHPDRPLGVVIGSSRTVWAFRPELLPEAPAAGDVYWVNVSHIESGPTLNRVILHRLLRDGVRPAAVVIEIMPRFFVKESDRVVVQNLAVTEFALVRRGADRTFDYDYHFLRQRFTRAGDLTRVTDPFAGVVEPCARGGYRLLRADLTADERARALALAHKMNADHLRQMTVHPGADRALRATLREAADHGIRAVLLRTPEGPTFRSWYDPDGLTRFDGYVAAVAAEFGAHQLDARLWLEEDDFADSHHVLKRGADKFTARFAREIPAVLATAH